MPASPETLVRLAKYGDDRAEFLLFGAQLIEGRFHPALARGQRLAIPLHLF